MGRKKKRAVVLAVTLVLIFMAGQATAAGSWLKRQVEVFYGDVEIFVNGKQLKTDIEPFVMDGQTMVPLRAINEALGVDVTWDANRHQVYIAGKPKIVIPPTPIEDLTVLRNVGPYYQMRNDFVIAHRPFDHGIAIELSKGDRSEVVVDLKGSFARLTGYAGVDDQTQNTSGAFHLEILGDNAQTLVSTDIRPGEYPTYISTTVKNYSTLTIKVNWIDGSIGDYERVLAALANFNLYK